MLALGIFLTILLLLYLLLVGYVTIRFAVACTRRRRLALWAVAISPPMALVAIGADSIGVDVFYVMVLAGFFVSAASAGVVAALFSWQPAAAFPVFLVAAVPFFIGWLPQTSWYVGPYILLAGVAFVAAASGRVRRAAATAALTNPVSE